MKLKSKTITYRGTTSGSRVLSLLVTLGMITTTSPLFGNDHEGKEQTRDSQTQPRLRADEQEDSNAKTDPQKFISHVANSGMKEIRLATLAKQRAQSQEVKQFADKLIQDHTKANQELKLIAQRQNIPWVTEKTSAAVSGTARGAGNIDTVENQAPITSRETETARSADRTQAEASRTARGAGAVDNSISAPVSAKSAVDRETPSAVNGTARGAYAANAPEVTYEQLASHTGKSFDETYMNHEVQCHTKALAKFEKASRDLPDGELKQFVNRTLPTLREHLAMAQRMAPSDASPLNIRERSGRDSKSAQDQANK